MDACPHERYRDVETCPVCEADEERDQYKARIARLEEALLECFPYYATMQASSVGAWEQEFPFLKEGAAGEGLTSGSVQPFPVGELIYLPVCKSCSRSESETPLGVSTKTGNFYCRECAPQGEYVLLPAAAPGGDP